MADKSDIILEELRIFREYAGKEFSCVKSAQSDQASKLTGLSAAIEAIRINHKDCKADRISVEQHLSLQYENRKTHVDGELDSLKKTRWKLVGVLVFLAAVIPVLITILLHFIP